MLTLLDCYLQLAAEEWERQCEAVQATLKELEVQSLAERDKLVQKLKEADDFQVIRRDKILDALGLSGDSVYAVRRPIPSQRPTGDGEYAGQGGRC